MGILVGCVSKRMSDCRGVSPSACLAFLISSPCLLPGLGSDPTARRICSPSDAHSHRPSQTCSNRHISDLPPSHYAAQYIIPLRPRFSEPTFLPSSRPALPRPPTLPSRHTTAIMVAGSYSPIHEASLVDPALHSPQMLEMLDTKLSRTLIG